VSYDVYPTQPPAFTNKQDVERLWDECPEDAVLGLYEGLSGLPDDLSSRDGLEAVDS
jgi:hypothetical protein